MSGPPLTNTSQNWKDFIEENEGKDLDVCLLFGTPSGGKSTVCELFLKNVAGSGNQNLVLDDSKTPKQYTLAGIISTNTYKTGTFKPKIYDISPKEINAPEEKIVDLPPFALPPFNQTYKKNYSTLEAKISQNLLFSSGIKKASFVLIIDDKNLRHPPTLRFILASFIDIFSESFENLPEELMNSTAILVSKTVEKIDQIVKRLDACNKKIQDSKTQKINQWLENIKKRNAIFIFKKLSTEEAIKDDIITIYESFTKLSKLEITPKAFQTINQFSPQVKQEALQYFQLFEIYMEKIIEIILDISAQYFKDYAEFFQKKEAIKKIFGLTNENQPEKQKNLPEIFNVLQLCSKISKFAEQVLTNPQANLQNLLQYLIQAQIVEKDDQVLQHLEAICYLNNKLRQLSPDFPWNLQKLSVILSKVNDTKKDQKILDYIVKNYENKGKDKKYYENIRIILEFLLTQQQREKNKAASQIWTENILSLCALEQNKGKALKDLIQLQQSLKKQGLENMIGSLLEKIAGLLIDVGELPNAIELYYKSGNPQEAIDQMTKYFKKTTLKGKNISQFVPYLTFLQNAGLYEKSYEVCIYLGSFFQEKQKRKELEPFLRKSPSAPSEQFFKYFIEKSIGELSKEEMDKYIKLSEKLEQQQKE